MSNAVYQRFAEHLDKMPGRYPKTESGVELKILKKLFTPEEAELSINLQVMPEPVASIAKRAGMDEAKASGMLEKMAKDGSIYRIKAGNQSLYMGISFIVGIYEFHVGSMDKELAELVEEYIPHFSKVWEATQTKQIRVVPIDKSLDSKTVASYNQLREMVKKHNLACVSPCICRKEQSLLGNQCDKPQDMCFQFGLAAQYYLDNGLGRKITIDEALELLDKAEENALVPQTTGAQEIMNICCCCECCCGILKNLKQMPRPADHVMSTYLAKIDPDTCTACGTCIERCQMEAILEGDDAMEVKPEQCIGCGLCLPTCPVEAITFVEKPDAVTPPANMMTMMMQITKERGA